MDKSSMERNAMINQLRESFTAAVKHIYPDIEIPPFDLVHPENEQFGDYASNIALVLASRAKDNPMHIAERIMAHFPSLSFVHKITVAPPGYINISLTYEYLTSIIEEIHTTQDQFGTSQKMQGQRILFEYGQPNTHKVPHIGHLFSYCYGESCSRLLEHAGAKVIRLNYQGDIGPHVAKCLWAYCKRGKPDPELLNEKIALLQQCYQEGSKAYESSSHAKDEIDEINNKIYNQDPDIVRVWEETRQWSLDAYKQFEERLGIVYDHWYLESETYELGKKIVLDHVNSIFEQDKAAIIFRGEPYGLHTRVFINSKGNPTYEAKDIGLAKKKWEEFDFTKSIIETGSDQSDYWRVEKQAIELIYPELKGKIETLHHGMINLTSGKMSSRTGDIISAFQLLELIKERIISRIEENRDYSKEESEAIAEALALGAIKYSFLKSNPKKDIAFDIETSISHEGNSGPYLQYTYARCQSVLKKANYRGECDLFTTTNDEEIALLRWLYRFPELVADAAQHYAPQLVSTYLYELAQRYSYFYNQHQIITDDTTTTQSRLALTWAVGQVLKNGLDLLGIAVTEKV
jgi:arginyl-tRNA synthetase